MPDHEAWLGLGPELDSGPEETGTGTGSLEGLAISNEAPDEQTSKTYLALRIYDCNPNHQSYKESRPELKWPETPKRKSASTGAFW